MQIRFSLDQLQVLEAIDRTGTFAGAAKELHRVPSAISYMVRTLEESLDLQLFDRSKHKAVLTTAGRRILEEGSELLMVARRMDAMAHELQTGWEPELHVVVDGVVPLGPVTRALRTFRDEEIPTRLRLDIEYQEGVPDRWESEEADLMIILDFEDSTDSLVRIPLPELQMLRLVAPDHPISELSVATAEDLGRGMELLVRDSSPRYARRDKKGFSEAEHRTWLSDFHSKRLALLAGAGHGWMPLHLVDDDLEAGRLVRLKTEGADQWTYHPELVHLKSRPLGRAGQRFVDELMTSINKVDD
jgi:DNA-binding transcriptional LysR family regulator